MLQLCMWLCQIRVKIINEIGINQVKRYQLDQDVSLVHQCANSGFANSDLPIRTNLMWGKFKWNFFFGYKYRQNFNILKPPWPKLYDERWSYIASNILHDEVKGAGESASYRIDRGWINLAWTTIKASAPSVEPRP